MGGAVAALAPMLAGGGIGGLIGPVLGSLASNLLAPSAPSAPAPAALPAPPQPAQAPAPPEVAVEAPQEAEDPVLDVEAAQVRAKKRRKEAENRRLFSLSDEDDSVVLTKSLLGE